MFCCFDCGGQGGSPSYPGQRSVPSGFYSSGGNALTNQPNYNQQQQPHNRDEESVCVTVPLGTNGGDQITVSSPSGTLVSATIPHGMRPGDTFIVEIPPNNNVHNDNNITKSSFNTSQIPTAPQNPNEGIVAIAAEVKPTAPFFPIPVPLPSSPITMQESRQDSTLKTTSQYRNTNYNHNRNRNNNQKHMLVKVPVGVAVGSTIHVQIPGENRMMAAQVPSGVSEFHVAYDPMPQNQQQYSNSNNTNGYGDNHKRFNSSSDTIGYGNGHGRNNNVQNDFRRNSNLSHSRGGGNGLDFVAPVLTGAALMGGAGYLISQHQNNQ